MSNKNGYPKEEKNDKLILGKVVDEIRKVIKGKIKEKVLIKKGDYREYRPLSSNWDHPSKNKTDLGEHTVKFTKDEMAKLHNDGELEKEDADGKMHTYLYSEGKLTEGMDRTKAAILLKQLGGNKFIAMTGAKGFAFSSKYMSFKIGRNSKGINFVRIAHNSMDTYDMEFGFVSVKGIKVKKKVKGVYNDMLGTIFTKYTGMHVRL